MIFILIFFELIANIIAVIYFNKAIKFMKNKIDSNKVLMYLCIQLTILEIYIILYPISYPDKWSTLRSNGPQYCTALAILAITFLLGVMVSLKYIKLRDISYLISGLVCSLISGLGFILYLLHFF